MARLSLPAGLLLASGLMLCAQDPPGREKKPPLLMADYRWEEDAREQKLKDQEVATLKKQGFVVTDRTYRQVFDPYLDKTQIFVTSDSLINAYAVLLEDSIFRFERLNARRLEAFLRAAWTGMEDLVENRQGDQALLKAASDRARIVMGVALELSSGKKSMAPPALAKIIDEEARRVIEATGQSKPIWLGPPDEGFMSIDYSRFKPRGFYAGDPVLERYFRATAWLQAIPFRFDKDEEFAAFLLLRKRCEDRSEKDLARAMESMRQSGEIHERLGGLIDDEDLMSSGPSWPEAPWTAAQLANVRLLFRELESDGAQIHDQIAFPGPGGKPERSFRILAARRLPDAVLFARTQNVRGSNFPSGLEIAAAQGSSLARQIIKSSAADWLARVEKEKDIFRGGSVYHEFLDALAVLLRPVDSPAPEIFRTPAWQEKSLQTFLGGWAQARHAWVLQAKQNFLTMGMRMAVPSVFVEPVPDFFNKMGQLALKTQETFTQAGAYDRNIADSAQNLRAMAAAWRRHAKSTLHDKDAAPAEEDMPLLSQSLGWIMALNAGEEDSAERGEDLEKVASTLEKLAVRIEKEGISTDARTQLFLRYADPTSDSKWSRFVMLCLQLEALGHKQLQGLPMGEKEEALADSFGEELAGIMFYEGNSYNTPRDDAPKIVDISTDKHAEKMLHAGIGRPRQIYVLYPYEGKQILTHGAILPYYEFVHEGRLTDREWVRLLSSPEAPGQPTWLNRVAGKIELPAKIRGPKKLGKVPFLPKRKHGSKIAPDQPVSWGVPG